MSDDDQEIERELERVIQSLDLSAILREEAERKAMGFQHIRMPLAQPVYVVTKVHLAEIIEHARKRYRRDAEWGYNSPDTVMASLLSLKECAPGKVDCASVGRALQLLHTSKMIGGANQGLIAVKNRMKLCRQVKS